MNNQIVIGLGEVGKAIQAILDCHGFDLKIPFDGKTPEVDVLHICFPYSDSFVSEVQGYQAVFGASLVIVHSTVPVGTCDDHGWTHSPIRGIHPNLEEGIRTFEKFFGGKDSLKAATIFHEKGIKVRTFMRAKETEAMKLWDTTIYGWNILLQKAIKEYCDINGLDFGVVYTLANETYNKGYLELGHPEYQKYILKDHPGPIGGHCVRQNWDLLEHWSIAILKSMHSVLTGGYDILDPYARKEGTIAEAREGLGRASGLASRTPDEEISKSELPPTERAGSNVQADTRV